jgi:ABC-type transporter Mla subunit MlaD
LISTRPVETRVRRSLTFLTVAGSSAIVPLTSLPDGARLADAQVAPSVEIDELLRTFDPATRRRFGQWLEAQSVAIDGRGAALNAAFGTLPGFEEDLTTLLASLDRQGAAVRAAVGNTGVVFDALSEQRAALRGLAVNGRRATQAFADQHDAFAGAWRALPAFEAESRRLLERAERFRRNADPVLSALRPGARAFSGALQEAPATAHELRGLSQALGPASRAAVRGLPAARRFFDDAAPLVREFVPFLAQFEPAIDYIGLNADSLATLVANLSAATQSTTSAFGTDAPLHYARALATLNPQALARFGEHRLSSNRANAYPSATPRFGATHPLTVLDAANCGAVTWPRLGPADPSALITEDLRSRILHFAYNDGTPVAPPCVLQRSPAFPRIQALSHSSGGPP